MTWSAVLDVVVGVMLLMLSYDNARLRRRLKRDEAERAEAVARALGDGMVRVDGFTLPSPSDPRWALQEVVMVNFEKKKFTELHAVLGSVTVSSDYFVYIRSGSSVPALKPTDALVRYAEQVYKNSQSRFVKKSLEVRDG